MVLQVGTVGKLIIGEGGTETSDTQFSSNPSAATLISETKLIVTQPEFMRRMMEQQRMGGGGMYGSFPEMHHVVVNANHPKVSALLEKKGDDQKIMVKQLTDLALLGQGLLKGEALNSFIERNIEQIA